MRVRVMAWDLNRKCAGFLKDFRGLQSAEALSFEDLDHSL